MYVPLTPALSQRERECPNARDPDAHGAWLAVGPGVVGDGGQRTGWRRRGSGAERTVQTRRRSTAPAVRRRRWRAPRCTPPSSSGCQVASSGADGVDLDAQDARRRRITLLQAVHQRTALDRGAVARRLHLGLASTSRGGHRQRQLDALANLPDALDGDVARAPATSTAWPATSSPGDGAPAWPPQPQLPRLAVGLRDGEHDPAVPRVLGLDRQTDRAPRRKLGLDRARRRTGGPAARSALTVAK